MHKWGKWGQCFILHLTMIAKGYQHMPEERSQPSERERLKDIFKKVRRLEITTRRVVNDVMAGEYQSSFKGRGMEFAEVREYQPGDDIRTIDWNVTARFGSPHVKVFAEERELTVILMVDMSSSLEFGTHEKTKGELATELCAILAFSAIQNNDRVGLIIFTDRIELYIPPKKGRRHVLRLLRELLYFRPEKKQTNIALALEYLSRVQNRRSVLFLVSDFLAKDYQQALRLANKRHDLVAITISDPRERDMPPLGLVELEDAETGETLVLDTYDEIARDEFAKIFEAGASERDKNFRRIDLDTIDIQTEKSYEQALVRFFRERARRLR
jgi:uncharacterized protein (DUF58 family)